VKSNVRNISIRGERQIEFRGYLKSVLIFPRAPDTHACVWKAVIRTQRHSP